MPRTSAPLRIGVVGAGRVGTVLAAGLRAAGHEITGVAARSEGARDRVAALLPGVPVMDAQQVARTCELLLLTVPDDALLGVARDLSAAGAVGPGCVVVHASGRYGTGHLAPVLPPGVLVVALHPAMTFTGTARDLPRLAGCPFAVTSDGPGDLAERLVNDVGGTTILLAEEQRVLYHAALVHGANHLVTLVAQAADLLHAAGVDATAATLRPLLEAALDNALTMGGAALTGPVVRADVATIGAHLDAIERERPSVLPAYRTMALATVATARRDGRLDETGAARVSSLLAGVPA